MSHSPRRKAIKFRRLAISQLLRGIIVPLDVTTDFDADGRIKTTIGVGPICARSRFPVQPPLWRAFQRLGNVLGESSNAFRRTFQTSRS